MTTLIEKYSIRKKTNNSSRTTYYGIIFNGNKNIKVKLDFYHFHNLNKDDNVLVISFGKRRKDYFILKRDIIENFAIGGFTNGTNNFNY